MIKIKPEVDVWIKNLSDEEMPGFAGTVAEVNEEISSEDTSAVDVAKSVLKDPALTSRLLKMANSFYYNPNRQQISTVSRAVMILGFEQVKALALSLVLIDSLKAGHQRDKLTDEIAQSFHAAVQAQEFAKLNQHESPENIFIAALLSRLGHMAFWAFADDEANQIIELSQRGITQLDAERIVLKFSLHELSQGLCKSWALGELLERALTDSGGDDIAITIIKQSHQLAESSKQGWGNVDTENCLAKLATELGVAVADIKDISLNNAKLAKEITQLYGVGTVSQRIPQPPLIDTGELEELGASKESDAEAEAEELMEEFPEPDPKLQLTILQDIANTVEERPDFNIILEMTLEGLHRGVGMDRAGFAILSKDHQSLSFKYALGKANEVLTGSVKVDLTQKDNIFRHIIDSKKAKHITSKYSIEGWSISEQTLKYMGLPPYLVMPAMVRGKVIGLFVADRHASKRQINDEDFQAFQQFCQQANMGLTFLTMQG